MKLLIKELVCIYKNIINTSNECPLFNFILSIYLFTICIYLYWQQFKENLVNMVIFNNFTFNFGELAQLARALAWHARGHRFDSGILHNITSTKPLFSKGFIFYRNLSDTSV